ncbi:hypothetical protein BC834DRAFT_978153 [Gloeopeniophorella convolvens]|nr:hypothetical protein BC834DRAFT_978153 [Gloeopeniophorella convolvens]
MRFKHLSSLLPLPKAKLFWDRITASRIAIFYLIFSILHCVVQVVFQVQAFTINKQAADFLTGIIDTGDALPRGFFVLGSQLRFCDHVPNSFSVSSCQLVWNGTIANSTNDASTSLLVGSNNDLGFSSVTSSVSVATSSSAEAPTSSNSSATSSDQASTVTSIAPSTAAPSAVVTKTVVEVAIATVTSTATAQESPNAKRSFLPKPHDDFTDIRAISLKGQTGVSLQGFGYNRKTVNLDNKCLVALNWPVQTLRNTKREDVAFLAFQFWVLGMSLVALLNESIPHLIATVFTHLSATAWGAFQIFQTGSFHKDFKRLTTDGACQINLLPNYWTSRARAEIPSLALNAAALLVSCFLSWRLIKLFGWQTFKRVGASRSINKIYKLILTLSIVIQLSLFFVIVTVALWLDQLYNGAIAVLAIRSNLYQSFMTVVLILLIPWLVTGWFAARRELKYPMMVFLVLSAFYLIGWSLMFDSTTFRWTFVQWSFFSAIATLSAVLVLIGLVVGIMCRLNFDKGLIRYLNAQEPLPGDDFVRVVPGEKGVDEEKVDFPSTGRPIPTFSATFGSGAEVPPPSQMRFNTMGPRFFNESATPFDLHIDTRSIAAPPTAYSASPKTGSPDSTRPLIRQGSQHSTASSTSSNTTITEQQHIGRARWVIE